jgi:NAD(P)H-dependent FMN reductase
MKPLKIAVIAGTSRTKRESIKAAKYVAAFGGTLPNVTILFAEPNDFIFPNDGNDPEGQDPRYHRLTVEADAFFIVTPEYNHSFPGSLKRMLDSEYASYIHKPVAFAGVSNGAWGGARAVEALVPAVREMGLVATSWSVYFPKVQDIFDETGGITLDSEAYYTKQLTHAYTELIWMARSLQWGRENL